MTIQTTDRKPAAGPPRRTRKTLTKYPRKSGRSPQKKDTATLRLGGPNLLLDAPILERTLTVPNETPVAVGRRVPRREDRGLARILDHTGRGRLLIGNRVGDLDLESDREGRGVRLGVGIHRGGRRVARGRIGGEGRGRDLTVAAGVRGHTDIELLLDTKRLYIFR